MEGPELHLLQAEGGGDLVGVIPRMVRGLFRDISAADDSLEFTVSVSFVEIYCEQLRDLLVSVDTEAVVAAHTPQGDGTPMMTPSTPSNTPSLGTPAGAARGTPLRPPSTPSDALSPPAPPQDSGSHKRRASTSSVPSAAEAKASSRGAQRRLSALSPPHGSSDTPSSRASHTPSHGEGGGKLAIREDKQGNVYLEGATEVFVTTPDMVLGVLQAGNESRSVAATAMNSRSSRSHSVFRLQLVKRDTETLAVTRATLFLVDLAGSEKIKKTHAEGQQLKEGQKINQSLSALGNVINALTDGKSKHIPYRNSKLTRLLQDSLGGNSRTSLIINASPASYNAEETLSSLRFGQRAKSMKNKPTANKEHSPAELKAMLAARDAELKRLKEMLHSGGGSAAGSGTASGTATPQELQAELEAERLARHDLEAKLQAAARQEDDLTVARRATLKASAEAATLKLKLEQMSKGSAELQGSSTKAHCELEALREEFEDLQEQLKQEQAGAAADKALRGDVERLLGNFARSVQPVLVARQRLASGSLAAATASSALPHEFAEALLLAAEHGGIGTNTEVGASPPASLDSPSGSPALHAAGGGGGGGGEVDSKSIMHTDDSSVQLDAEEEEECKHRAQHAMQAFEALGSTVQAQAWQGPDAFGSDLARLFSTVGGMALSAISAQVGDGQRAVDEVGAAVYSACRARCALHTVRAEVALLREKMQSVTAQRDDAAAKLHEVLQQNTATAAAQSSEHSEMDDLHSAVVAQLELCASTLKSILPDASEGGLITDVAALATSVQPLKQGKQDKDFPHQQLESSAKYLLGLCSSVQSATRVKQDQLAAVKQEQQKLLGHLENRVRRVIELEMTLDEAQERFVKLETTKDRPSVELARENASLRRALSEQAGRYARESTALEHLQASNAKLNARAQELRNELTKTREELAQLQQSRMDGRWHEPPLGRHAAAAAAAVTSPGAAGGVMSRSAAASLGLYSAPSAAVIQSWTKPVSVRGGGGGGADLSSQESGAVQGAGASTPLPSGGRSDSRHPPSSPVHAHHASNVHGLRRSASFSEHHLPSALQAFQDATSS